MDGVTGRLMQLGLQASVQDTLSREGGAGPDGAPVSSHGMKREWKRSQLARPGGDLLLAQTQRKQWRENKTNGLKVMENGEVRRPTEATFTTRSCTFPESASAEVTQPLERETSRFCCSVCGSDATGAAHNRFLSKLLQHT